jgi:integrase
MARRRDRSKTLYPGVERAGKGLYRIRGTYIHPKTGRRRELDRIVTAESPAEASAKRNAALREAAGSVAEERPRVEAFARSWLLGKAPGLRQSTRTTYASALDNHILPHFGDWFIDRVTFADVVAWRDAQKGEPITINGWLRVFKTLMADAKQILCLDVDPTARVESLPEGPKKHKTLAPDELRGLLAAMREVEPQWYPISIFLAHTGARFGEASALEWRDIDWTTESIRIERAHVRGALDATKTDDPRVVPLTADVAEALRAHRLRTGEFDLVFPARRRKGRDKADMRNLGYSQPSALRKPLANGCKRAGISRRVTSHHFRHTWNNLLRQTADRETQQALIGHSTEEMSIHYSHISLGEKRAAVVRVLELVKKGGG